MRRSLLPMFAIVALGACGSKTPPADQAATVSGQPADSAAVADSVAADHAAVTGAAPGAPAGTGVVGTPSAAATKAAKDSAATKAAAAIKQPGGIIGRDSAFGPTFTVDSTGKVTPIPPAKKKP